MNSTVAVCAAIGCAICNAIAAILQKTSSDKVTTIDSFSPSTLLKLAKQLSYVLGTFFDLLAGIFTLIAVNRLPLFLVQAIIASSVVLTAFLERLFLQRRLQMQTYSATAFVLIGLASLAAASHSSTATSVSHMTKDIFELLPVAFAVMGSIALRFKGKSSAALLAALSGIGFGGVSIAGRLIIYPRPIWHTIQDPLLWALAVYGALGLYFFTAALQRTAATIANGIMLSTETLVPTIVGILMLGDTPRSGLWLPLWFGCALVASGCVYLAATDA